MPDLVVDFVTSLDGHAAADGWPGWWGLEGPEYLAWLGDHPEADYLVLMGANTYRLMAGFAADSEPGTDALGALSKLVFSSTLTEPLTWENSTLVTGDPVEAVRQMKEDGAKSMRHDRLYHALPFSARSGTCRPFPRGRIPRHHRDQRPGTHL